MNIANQNRQIDETINQLKILGEKLPRENQITQRILQLIPLLQYYKDNINIRYKNASKEGNMIVKKALSDQRCLTHIREHEGVTAPNFINNIIAAVNLLVQALETNSPDEIIEKIGEPGPCVDDLLENIMNASIESEKSESLLFMALAEIVNQYMDTIPAGTKYNSDDIMLDKIYFSGFQSAINSAFESLDSPKYPRWKGYYMPFKEIVRTILVPNGLVDYTSLISAKAGGKRSGKARTRSKTVIKRRKYRKSKQAGMKRYRTQRTYKRHI